MVGHAGLVSSQKQTNSKIISVCFTLTRLLLTLYCIACQRWNVRSKFRIEDKKIGSKSFPDDRRQS